MAEQRPVQKQLISTRPAVALRITNSAPTAKRSVASPARSRVLRRSEYAQRPVPVGELDSAKFTGHVAGLRDGLGDEPGADHP